MVSLEGMNYRHYEVKCNNCGRHIIVEAVINGNNHNSVIGAACCLNMNKQFINEHPNDAKVIEEWLAKETV